MACGTRGDEQAAPRSRAARLRESSERLARRAEAERARHRSVDAVLEMVERDGEVAGGILAGALAYRLFIWLLPLALIAVAGLGFAADVASESAEDAQEARRRRRRRQGDAVGATRTA